MKLAYLDLEFHDTAERDLKLVSLSVLTTVDRKKDREQTYWLYEGMTSDHWYMAEQFIAELILTGYIFVSYSAEAEMRALLTLMSDSWTIDGEHWAKQIKFIDLYLEYRCLLNRNHDLQYGQQYIAGKVITTTPPLPKWVREEQDDNDELHHKPSYSLAGACFKLLGEKIDTETKDELRKIIIAGVCGDILSNKDRILAYNRSDIELLPRLLSAQVKTYDRLGVGLSVFLSAALQRGDYAAATAKMVRLGYPVNRAKIEKFISNVKPILNAAIEDVNAAPIILPSEPDPLMGFRKDKKTGSWVCNTKAIQRWAEAQQLPKWRKTSGKKYSISKDAFNDWFDSQSEGFPGAYCRYLKIKQSLNGFISASGKKGSFSDHLGQDGRVRPYFGIYGSQSSRSQPGSVGFIPLKAHWMRNFIEAPPGRALAGVDFSSQEFLIAAVISQDKEMMAAYGSGDPYLAFGKAAKLLPPEATKKSHAKMREVLKQVVLGVSYDMSANGLAPRLSRITGKDVTVLEAQGLIDAFFETYIYYAEWKKETVREYMDEGSLSLSDGWVMWGDNDNMRSVGNFPIQGQGAVVMREAVKTAQKYLDVIYTLHDALYIEYASYKTGSIAFLMGCMAGAFEKVMSRYGSTVPIRLEGESWSVDYGDKMPDPMEGVVFMSEYSDPKGEADLRRYREFFT